MVALILLWKSRGSERAALLGDWRAVRKGWYAAHGHSFSLLWHALFFFFPVVLCKFRKNFCFFSVASL